MTTIGTGLDAQIGIGIQSDYVTKAAPTQFFEFTKESLKPDVWKGYSRSLGDQTMRSGRVRTALVGGGGDIELDFMSKGMQRLLKLMLGSETTASGVYTYHLDTAGLKGLSATVQVGRPSIDGTVRPFNFIGGKITDWSIDTEIEKNLSMKLGWDFRAADVAGSVSTVSIPASQAPMSFIDGVVTINGATKNVQKFSLGAKRAMATKRISLGVNKREPLANGEFELTGSLDMEFEDLTYYQKWLVGEVGSAALTFAMPAAYGSASLVITIPALEFTGESPMVESSDILKNPLPYKVLNDGTDAFIELVYTPAPDA